MRFLIFIVTLIFLSGSCRLARKGGGNQDSESVQPAVSTGPTGASSGGQQSKPVGSGGEAVIGLNLDADGRLLDRIGTRLDYFPAPRPDGVSIVICHDELLADTVMGRVTCDSDQGLVVDLTAGHTLQQCYTSSPKKTIEATRTLQLAGCRGRATFRGLQRIPDLKVEILN